MADSIEQPRLSNRVAGASFKIRGSLIFWIFVIGAVTYFDRVDISIIGTEIAQDFDITNVQLGWVFSAFIAGYAVFQAPAGWLADRYGPRIILTVALVWWSVFASALTIASPRFVLPIVALISVRFFLGAGEALVYPASNCIVGAWIPSSERGLANGLIFSGVGCGRCKFFAVHPRMLRGHAIQSGAPVSEFGSEIRGNPGWRGILRNRNLLTLAFSYFCYGYEAYIFFSWFFIYLHTARGLDLKRGGYYSVLPFLAMAVCSPAGGRISDLLTRKMGPRVGRCYLSAIAISVSAVFLILGTRVATAEFASVVLAGGAGALYPSQSCYWSMSADIGRRSAGSASGLMNIGRQLGGAVTASLTPCIADRFGWTDSFLLAAALTAAGAAAWMFIEPVDRVTADVG